MPRAHIVATTFLAMVIGVALPASASAGNHRKPAPSANALAVPQLDIAITDGRLSAARGDVLTYTIKVRNLGTTDVAALRVTQTLPAGLIFVSSDHGGVTNTSGVSWTLDLKPGEEFTVATVGRIGQLPSELLRLASVACATVKGDGKPLVCATHSDLLPAGTASAHVRRPASHLIWYGAGGVVLLGAGLVAYILVRRRNPVRLGA